MMQLFGSSNSAPAARYQDLPCHTAVAVVGRYPTQAHLNRLSMWGLDLYPTASFCLA